MKQKKIKIANGLNKLVYDRDEDPVDGVKLPFEQLAVLCHEGEKLGVKLARQMMVKVEQKFKCKQWQMSDGLKNAGKGGGVVRLKGTTEIIIQ